MLHRLPGLVKAPEAQAPHIAVLVEERQLQWEEEQRQWNAMMQRQPREMELRRLAQAEKESRDELASILSAWSDARWYEEFYRDIERRLASDTSGANKAVMSKLAEAQTLSGTADLLERFITRKAPDER